MELQDLPEDNSCSWDSWRVLQRNPEEAGLAQGEDKLQEAEMMGRRLGWRQQVWVAEHQEMSWAWTVPAEKAGWGREQDQQVWPLLVQMAETVRQLQMRKSITCFMWKLLLMLSMLLSLPSSKPYPRISIPGISPTIQATSVKFYHKIGCGFSSPVYV